MGTSPVWRRTGKPGMRTGICRPAARTLEEYRMKIARYQADGQVRYGILEDDRIRRLKEAPYVSLTPSGETDRLADVRLLAPVEAPRIFGVGLNYKAHIAESKHKAPVIPMLFMKPTTAAVGPGDAIVYPREG